MATANARNRSDRNAGRRKDWARAPGKDGEASASDKVTIRSLNGYLGEVDHAFRRWPSTVFDGTVVLVLSATVLVLVLVLERIVMAEPTFDHERLDVYRLWIDYVAFSFQLAKGLGGVNRQARDQWRRAAQSIPLNIAEGNGKQSLKHKIDSSTLLMVRRWNVQQFMMYRMSELQWMMNPMGAAKRT